MPCLQYTLHMSVMVQVIPGIVHTDLWLAWQSFFDTLLPAYVYYLNLIC